MEAICCQDLEETTLYHTRQRLRGETSFTASCLPAHILKACGEIIRKCDVAILQQRREPDARVHAERRENQKTDRENEGLSSGQIAHTDTSSWRQIGTAVALLINAASIVI